MSIAEEDLTLLREAVAEIAKSTAGDITRKKTNWTTSLSAQVTRLEETVTEVRDTGSTPTLKNRNSHAGIFYKCSRNRYNFP